MRHGPSERPAARRIRPRALPGLRVRRWHRAPRDAEVTRTRHPDALPERSALPGELLMLIRVPLSWLREYVDVTVPVDELASRLHMSGTEVKGIERRAWDKIWVGRVAELAKHPDAERLWLATVDYGEGRRKRVVTAATNLSAGAIVAFGDVGAEYVDGHSGE